MSELNSTSESFSSKPLSVLVNGIYELIDKPEVDPAVLRQLLLNAALRSRSVESYTWFVETLTQLSPSILNEHLPYLSPLFDRLNSEEQWRAFFRVYSYLNRSSDFKQWSSFFSTINQFSLSNDSLVGYFKTLEFICKSGRSIKLEFLFSAVHSTITSDNSGEFDFTLLKHYLTLTSSAECIHRLLRALPVLSKYQDAFSLGQIESKVWLLEEAIQCLPPKWGQVFIYGGWVGLLPRMIFDSNVDVERIRNFEIDKEAAIISEDFNKDEVMANWKYKSVLSDVNHLKGPNFEFDLIKKNGELVRVCETPQVIINTSCEHFSDQTWFETIPPGTIVILQSNNGYGIEGHVNCFSSLSDFVDSLKLAKIYYQGSRPLPEFNRYMVIGVR